MSASFTFFASTLIAALGQPLSIARPDPQIWISDPRMIEVQVLGTKLVLIPKQRGLVYGSGLKTNTLDTQRIYVTTPANAEALMTCPTSPVELSGSEPLIKSDDLERLNWMSNNCGFDELRVSDSAQKTLGPEIEKIESKLRLRGYKISQSKWDQGRRTLQIDTAQSDLSSLRSLLGSLAPLYRVDAKATARPGRTLIFELSVFEFSRTKAQKLGLKWPDGFQLKTIDGAHFEVADGSGSPGLQLGADFGESLGVGRILAKPQIRTLPGQKASFQSGGELPIHNSTAYSSQTTWRSYGLIVTLDPSNDIQTGAQEISLGFSVELSEPDASTAINGIPGMLTRKLESHFDLRVGEQTILTSMIQSKGGHTQAGLAGLSWLGKLFSSQTDMSYDSELWFSLKPTWEEIPIPMASKLGQR